MNILGINQIQGMFAWMHDSAAALVKDGKLIATAEEERFTRLRHMKGYPYKSIDFCLKEGGINKKEVHILAIGYDPYQFLKRLPPNLHWRTLGQNVINLGVFRFAQSFLKKEFPQARIVYIPHHRAHAASAFRCSGFSEANVFTFDGSGETETFTFFLGKDGRIEKQWEIGLDGPFGNGKRSSIGFMYSAVTQYLNLGNHAEGKTMGLASYGTPRYDFSQILNIKNHQDMTIDRGKIKRLYPEIERKGYQDPITQEQKDLAASLQHALEESLLNLTREGYKHSGIRNVCLAGGVALNCNTNSRIQDSDFCDHLYVQPAASDGGVALGAALEAASQVESPINFQMDTAYWGPGYSNEEIEQLLKDAKITYSFHENIEEIAADILAEGKVIGWFQGRMELGPRALCNRSIMADPSVPGMNDRVNQIKHREVWRPFAPVVLEEDGAEFFEKYTPSPFMLLTYYVKPEKRALLPAITHVDGSSRIQTINAHQNPRCYALLQSFKKRKGFGILMNTSFNDKDEPIVCTPKDALKCFYGTAMDALILGNYLVRK